MFVSTNCFKDLPKTFDNREKNKEMKEDGYNPYVNNNGSLLGFKGKDYLILGSDTRLSVGYSILSRDSPKIFKITEKAYLASSGMYADIIALQKNLKIRVDLYKSANHYEPSIECLAQLLSVTLYGRRFFPYYTFNCLAGVNDDGEMKMYGYDAIGSYDELEYLSNGSGKELITPVLDSLLKYPDSKLDLETGKKLALTAINACANRDIYTGDYFEMVVLHKDGRVELSKHDLRKD